MNTFRVFKGERKSKRKNNPSLTQDFTYKNMSRESNLFANDYAAYAVQIFLGSTRQNPDVKTVLNKYSCHETTKMSPKLHCFIYLFIWNGQNENHEFVFCNPYDLRWLLQFFFLFFKIKLSPLSHSRSYKDGSRLPVSQSLQAYPKTHGDLQRERFHTWGVSNSGPEHTAGYYSCYYFYFVDHTHTEMQIFTDNYMYTHELLLLIGIENYHYYYYY